MAVLGLEGIPRRVGEDVLWQAGHLSNIHSCRAVDSAGNLGEDEAWGFSLRRLTL
jgi:hypothetical protein